MEFSIWYLDVFILHFFKSYICKNEFSVSIVAHVRSGLRTLVQECGLLNFHSAKRR